MNQELSLAKKELATLVTELDTFCSKKALANNLINEINEKISNQTINLTVLGEFNRGKSTFINSLIGSDLLPTAVTPNTASINILKYSEEPYLKVLYHDKNSEFKALEESTFNNLNYEEISNIEIGNNSDFLKNVVIVDTPGVNDINNQRIEVTYNFIPKSDAVIFLLDSEQVLSKSEFDFFESKILTADINKIIFVLNKTDNLQKEEIREVLEYTHQKLSNYINNPVIITYSAKKALQGKKYKNYATLEVANYDNLVKAITSNIFEKQDNILVDRVTHNLGFLISDLTNKLKLKKALFNKSIQELEESVNLIKSKETDLNAELEAVLASFRKAIKEINETEIKKLKSFSLELYEVLVEDSPDLSYQEVKTHLPLYIQDKFKEQIELQEIEIKASILELYQDSVEKIGKIFESIKEDIDLKIDFSLIKLKTINKTNSLDLGSSALMTSGLFVMFLGGLFPLIGGLLMVAGGGFLSLNSKESMQKNLKSELIKIAHNSINTSVEKIGSKISAIIDDISLKIEENLKNLFKEEFDSINNSITSVLETKKLKEVETGEKIAELDSDLAFLAEKNNQVLAISNGLIG